MLYKSWGKTSKSGGFIFYAELFHNVTDKKKLNANASLGLLSTADNDSWHY